MLNKSKYALLLNHCGFQFDREYRMDPNRFLVVQDSFKLGKRVAFAGCWDEPADLDRLHGLLRGLALDVLSKTREDEPVRTVALEFV